MLNEREKIVGKPVILTKNSATTQREHEQYVKKIQVHAHLCLNNRTSLVLLAMLTPYYGLTVLVVGVGGGGGGYNAESIVP